MYRRILGTLVVVGALAAFAMPSSASALTSDIDNVQLGTSWQYVNSTQYHTSAGCALYVNCPVLVRWRNGGVGRQTQFAIQSCTDGSGYGSTDTIPSYDDTWHAGAYLGSSGFCFRIMGRVAPGQSYMANAHDAQVSR